MCFKFSVLNPNFYFYPMSTKAILEQETPDSALSKLLEGNTRFINHLHTFRDFMEEVDQTKEDQYPFAIILGCIDSRVPVEILFDQGIGDLFVTRTAGNIVNPDILGGMEYACSVVGSKLIMVLGHEGCGAVKAACDDIQLGHLTEVIHKIKPAINSSDCLEEISSSNTECVNTVAINNVKQTIENIRLQSTILKELEYEGKIKIVGAFYRLHSGRVEVIENL